MWLKLSFKGESTLVNTKEVEMIKDSKIFFRDDFKGVQIDQSVDDIWNAIYQKEPCVDLTKKE